MSNELILAELDILPEHLKAQVVSYIRFLKSPFVHQEPMMHQMPPSTKQPRFGFGKYKVEIAADFDEPLEDFKEYM